MSSIDLIPVVLVLIAACVDLKCREIPDSIPLSILLGAASIWMIGWSKISWWEHLAGCIVATSLALAIGRGDRFGGGDIKLFGALGGWFGLFALLPLAMWIAIAGLPLAIIAAARKQTDYAYGPAIFMGVCVHWISPDLIHRIML